MDMNRVRIGFAESLGIVLGVDEQVTTLLGLCFLTLSPDLTDRTDTYVDMTSKLCILIHIYKEMCHCWNHFPDGQFGTWAVRNRIWSYTPTIVNIRVTVYTTEVSDEIDNSRNQ